MFARPVRALIRLRATARCNSTVAPAASADAGEKTAPRRTVPILQEFGDIKIREVLHCLAETACSVRLRECSQSKVGPNWVGDLGLGSGGGGGLADKLARRKRQNVGGSTSNDAGLEVVLNADGTPQAPELSIPARTQRSNGDRQSSARGEKRQGGANRGNNTRSQGGDRAARPQERGDRAARPQERGDRTARPQERGDRTTRPQRGDSQNQRLRPEKQYSANRSSDRRSKTRDEDVRPLVVLYLSHPFKSNRRPRESRSRRQS
ncbi:uncharacterized protein B0H18DRAFT_457676 [Fomitopsis serialis]|uniref:uncharacterized protein n=1 Tax=Fomitopsis serialis TaxID=139415 RepID=UPI0020086E78|nr:uncharacterized protein B0H18DRAFT_457676 [Neoantrodia serialis]KAH9923636.1 hypothetical protein B0H18DRAFT_457676 [Neoantrodia serialis]